MTGGPARRRRQAALLWLAAGVVVWNGIYDLLLTRGVKEYLFRHALHEAGGGPFVPMARIMEQTVGDAVWISSIWAALIVAAGWLTIWWVAGPLARGGRGAPGR